MCGGGLPGGVGEPAVEKLRWEKFPDELRAYHDSVRHVADLRFEIETNLQAGAPLWHVSACQGASTAAGRTSVQARAAGNGTRPMPTGTAGAGPGAAGITQAAERGGRAPAAVGGRAEGAAPEGRHAAAAHTSIQADDEQSRDASRRGAAAQSASGTMLHGSPPAQ